MSTCEYCYLMAEQFEHAATVLESAARVYGLLASSRRQRLLFALGSQEDGVAIADVARDIAECEHGLPFQELSQEEVEKVYLNLYHSHIPKLVNADVISCDSEQQTVALTEQGIQISRLAHRLSEEISQTKANGGLPELD